MSDKKTKKPGFFQKLFGMSSSSSSPSNSSSHTSKSASRPAGQPIRDGPFPEEDIRRQKKQNLDNSGGRPEPRKQAASTSGGKPSARAGTGASRPAGEGGARPPKVQQSMSAPAGTSGAGALDRQQQQRAGQQIGGKNSPEGRASGRKSRRRKGAGKRGLSSLSNIDVSKPLDFPTTPEQILARHKAKPFLNKNEEWLLVELNEFECLVDSIDIIKTIAKHSQFFEVEPDELWEEFFEFVEEMPSYDDIINFDVWQEFRDQKYPC